MTFMEKFSDNVQKYPDRLILADDTNPKGLTVSQVDNYSGRVYSYLQEKGIGKEDFVMICLPRGILPLIAMLGVWKNGSAYVLVEDNYAPERIEFIKNDCECKLVINLEIMKEMREYESKPGFEKTDVHDAAFAVYTSGTTGNPKGVLHEYGNIDRMLESVDMTSCDQLATAEDRFALVAPLNFIASTIIAVYFFERAVFNYVVSYKTLKNPMMIGMFMTMNKITGTFLTPSHIRKMGNKKIPGLRFCFIGSEPANEVYVDGLLIHNFYMMSESGFVVAHFLVDKMYEKTPVGGSEFGHKLYLLDEQGNEVADGEEGEICFENDYVRGYMNLPEQTAEAFKDCGDGRGRLYHTGDLAVRDELGRLIICGRLSDMVKINGNRVEPGEIEGVAKKVLKVDWTAARIFDDGNRVFIALYYKDEITMSEEQIRKEMEQYLPYYMIPSFFVHIDEVPLRPNGKMDRKALPKPDFNDYRESYVAPRDDVEKALCDAFSKALKIEQIGIKDDFYQLGGDSLASMVVIEKSGLPDLQATQIFRGHTAEKIAEIYKKEYSATENVDIEQANKEALSQPQYLTTEQIYMMDYQLYTPNSTMYNLAVALKLDKEIFDLNKLADAIKTTVINHPALLTIFFFNEDGELMQKHNPDAWKDIEIEHVSEEEFDKIKDTLIKPFIMINRLLFRCRVFETEQAGYLFMDVHHTLFDGTSFKIFFGDLLKAYFGQPLEPDYYYYNILRREKLTQTPFYEESFEYFSKRYTSSGIDWLPYPYPLIDNKTRENKNDSIVHRLPVQTDKYEKELELNGLSPNAFFIAANILATAFYSGYRHIMVSWIYNGRTDMKEMTTVGLMFRNLPVAVSLSSGMTLAGLFEEVIDQINKGIEHSCYAAVEKHCNVVDDDIICVLYQDDLREIANVPGLLGEVEIKQNNAASQNLLDLEFLNSADGIEVILDYASSRYDAKSMERYRDVMSDIITIMINHAEDSGATIKSVLAEAAGNNSDGLEWLDKE